MDGMWKLINRAVLKITIVCVLRCFRAVNPSQHFFLFSVAFYRNS